VGRRVQPVRELRLVFATTPLTLDPQRHREDLTRMVLANFYEGLASFDGNLQIRPCLAVEWTNPADTVWRFRLRPGVRFHDGTAFGAEDVRRTIERARRAEGTAVEADVRAIVEVRVLDPLTVELVTDRARPLLLAKLAHTPILPRTVSDAPITAPIGTGPYRFAGASANLDRVSGIRFDGYWGPIPAHPGFRIEVADGEQRRLELVRQGADLATPVSGVRAGSDGVRILSHRTVTTTFLLCRIAPLAGGQPSPFRDPRVRHAINLAIDRQGLVDRTSPGEAEASWQPAPPGVSGHLPDLAPPTPDPAGARSLLRGAGFPSGIRSTLLVSTRGVDAGRELARQLAAVGIQLEVEPLEWAELYARMKGGQAPLALASWSMITGDASSLYEPVLHSASGPPGFGEENTTGYANPALDAAIAAAAQEMRSPARVLLMWRIVRLTLDDLPLIPVYTPMWTYAVRKDLAFAPRLDLAVVAADLRPLPPS